MLRLPFPLNELLSVSSALELVRARDREGTDT